MGGYNIIRRDCHAAVVVSAAVEHVSGCEIGDAHQRIVGRSLHVISVESTLRHAVKAETIDLVGAAGPDEGRRAEDERRPFWLVAAFRGIEFDVVGEIRKQDLSVGKHQHVSEERAVYGRAWGTRNGLKISASPLEEEGRKIA